MTLTYKWYMMSSDLSLVHLIVGAGSPTELQGRRTSFIQGVVTVPPKDRILAGTAHIKHKVIKLHLGHTNNNKNTITKPKLMISHTHTFLQSLPKGKRPLLTAVSCFSVTPPLTS